MSGQSDDPEERIEDGNRVLVRPFGHPVTVNEVHAVLLGLSAGVFVGALYAAGYSEVPTGLAATLVGYSLLGKPFLKSLPHAAEKYADAEEKTIAVRTVKYEPWWFLSSFTSAVGLSYTLVPLFA